jgi:methanol metabolism-related c-type cytochrome
VKGSVLQPEHQREGSFRCLLHAEAAVIAFVLVAGMSGPGRADAPADPAAVKSEGGEYRDANGDPTFKIAPDGTVDYYTFQGYIRYTANCMQCHGPGGQGSSFGPALANSLKTLDYDQFAGIVANGKKNVNAAQELVMPAFGANRNVMCFIEPIYVYLRARSVGAIGPTRPQKNDPKPAEFAKQEDACMQ